MWGSSSWRYNNRTGKRNKWITFDEEMIRMYVNMRTLFYHITPPFPFLILCLFVNSLSLVTRFILCVSQSSSSPSPGGSPAPLTSNVERGPGRAGVADGGNGAGQPVKQHGDAGENAGGGSAATGSGGVDWSDGGVS